MTQLIEALVGLPVAWSILLKATALLAAGWIGQMALQRANPRWRVLMWRGVVMGLIALPVVSGLLELRLEVEKPLPPRVPVIQYPAPMVAMAIAVPAAVEPQTGWMPAPAASFAPTPPPKPRFSLTTFVVGHWAWMLIAIWAFGVVLLGLRVAGCCLRMRKLFAAAKPVSAAHYRTLDRVARGLNCREAIALKSSRELASPLLAGLTQPTIYVPARMLESATEEELAAILAHEVAHVKSHDLYWLLAARWCAIALWPHPFAWRMPVAHMAACEEVSDAVAAGYLNDASAYVRTLARVALAVAGRPVMAGGIPMARSSQIAWRLKILKTKFHASPLARRSVFTAVAIGALALITLGGVRLVYAQPQPKPRQESRRIPDPPLPPGARVVHFPTDRSAGLVMLGYRPMADAHFKDLLEITALNSGLDWVQCGQAQGDVIVPAGQQLKLVVNPFTNDLSALAGLGPNDLDALWISCYPNQVSDFNAAILPQIRHLTGLKSLSLDHFRINEAGAKGLGIFASLRALRISGEPKYSLGEADIAALANLKSLEILSLNSDHITDAGMAQLARIKTLRKLGLSTGNIAGPGLVELANLPVLESFVAAGMAFDDSKLAYLKHVSGLKYLTITDPKITNSGMAMFGSFKKLEKLDLFRDSLLSDEGLANLGAMPALKWLDIGSGKFTARGIASLTSLQTLEELKLPNNYMNDQVLAELGKLKNLRYLWVGCNTPGGPISDAGLRQLANCTKLEDLHIAGSEIGDAGMDALAALNNLKTLHLYHAPRVTNAGLARLGTMKSLRDLKLNAWSTDKLDISVAGVNQLGGCPELRSIDIADVRQDGAGLDLTGAGKLESLIIRTADGHAWRDEDLANFARMKNLTTLSVGVGNSYSRWALTVTNGISDAGVAQLATTPWLTEISIAGGPKLTDGGLAFLARLENPAKISVTGNFTDAALRQIGSAKSLRGLQELRISGNFSDEGLKQIESLKRLSSLHISSGNQLSGAAVKRLQANLPYIPAYAFSVRGDRELPEYKPEPAVKNIEPMHSTSTSGAIGGAVSVPPGARVLHFPTDRSMGTLTLRDASRKRQIDTFYYWVDDPYNDSWRVVGEARGDVIVPAGKRVALMITPEGARDMTPLARLGPNDLDTLNYNYTLSDAGLACIAGLKGLTELNLTSYDQDRGANAPVFYTSDGLKALEGLDNLEYLSTPSQMDDAGLAHAARLKSLKGLYIKTNKLTDAGLAQIANIPSLEEIAIGGGEISDAGLAHLAMLPRLSYLMLWGKNFSDTGIAYLPRIQNLKILHLGSIPITDAGMESIGRIRGLQNVNLHGVGITDDGLVHLTNLKSLRKLDVSGTSVTGRGIQILKQCKTLDHLRLPDNILNDESLAALSELTNLKYLWILNSRKADRAQEKMYYTDRGIARLCSNAPGIEELLIGGIGLTDSSMAHIAKLKKLKRLNIFASPSIANAGLAELANSRSLQSIDCHSLNVTVAGVNHLNKIQTLRDLTIDFPENKVFADETLDLSNLTRLEKISIPVLRDRDLVCFKNLKQLRWLQTGHFEWQFNEITDAGMANLAGLVNMDRLTIDGRALTDKSLDHLAGMTNIDSLSLRGGFTDAGLQKLERFKTIRHLRIQSDKSFSDGAIERLHASLPMVFMFGVEGDKVYPTEPPPRRAANRPNASPAKAGHPKVGTPAPDFTVTTTEGTKFSLSDQRGRVVLIQFWATWCAPCVKNAPANKKMQDELKERFGNDFVWVDLSLDDFDAPVKEHVEKFGLKAVEARIGTGSRIAADYGVQGVPDAFLIAPDGKVLLNRESPQVDTETAIARALKQ